MVVGMLTTIMRMSVSNSSNIPTIMLKIIPKKEKIIRNTMHSKKGSNRKERGRENIKKENGKKKHQNDGNGDRKLQRWWVHLHLSSITKTVADNVLIFH